MAKREKKRVKLQSYVDRSDLELKGLIIITMIIIITIIIIIM